jgi:hypothetical protein
MAKDTPADLIEALKEQKVSLASIALDYARQLLWRLQTALQQSNTPPAAPKPAPEPLPAPQPAPTTPDHLEAWAKAIQAFEGWYPGSVSFTHNNPGNIKGANGAFLTFKTYEDGLAYLEDYLTRAATGKHPAFKPSMTLNQFFHIYTSDREPVPTNYAKSVATAIGCTVDTKIAELVSVVS